MAHFIGPFVLGAGPVRWARLKRMLRVTACLNRAVYSAASGVCTIVSVSATSIAPLTDWAMVQFG